MGWKLTHCRLRKSMGYICGLKNTGLETYVLLENTYKGNYLSTFSEESQSNHWINLWSNRFFLNYTERAHQFISCSKQGISSIQIKTSSLSLVRVIDSGGPKLRIYKLLLISGTFGFDFQTITVYCFERTTYFNILKETCLNGFELSALVETS